MPIVTTTDITVIAPCYNELDNLVPLIDEIYAVLSKTGRSFEILYVDDHSNDGTTEKLDSLVTERDYLRVVHHNNNYGESAGNLTGFANARGRLVFTIDADLQNDPADMPEMIRILEEEHLDCVTGVRRKREDSITKRISSRTANFVRGSLLHDNIHDAGCTYRVMRAEALCGLPSFKALHRFLPSILQWHGYKVKEMLVNDRRRKFGKSKYGIGNRLWVGIYDMFAMRWYRRRFLPPHRVDE
ncbi:MAG: glycosyltransferase family 2 protein [Candidatus Sumerlaeales bacterium]|nr:glycosyltransferase family 2 protein [Candidatus Sumerlaeales bacterium]